MVSGNSSCATPPTSAARIRPLGDPGRPDLRRIPGLARAALLTTPLLLGLGTITPARSAAAGPLAASRPDPVVQAREALTAAREEAERLSQRVAALFNNLAAPRDKLDFAEQQRFEANRQLSEAQYELAAIRQQVESSRQEARQIRETADRLAGELEFSQQRAQDARRRANEAVERAQQSGNSESVNEANAALAEAREADQQVEVARLVAEFAASRAFQAELIAGGLTHSLTLAEGKEAAAASRKREADTFRDETRSELESSEREAREAAEQAALSGARAEAADNRLQELQEAEGRCGGRSGVLALIAAIPACLPESSSEQEGHSFPNLTIDPVRFLFVDPILAIGYDYKITSGSPLISQVLLPLINGTSLYDLVGDSSGGACSSFTTPLGSATPGVPFTFSSPVSCFGVRGIEVASALDPNDPLAFVTGILGSTSGSVSLSQIPVTFNTDSLKASTGAPAPLPLLGAPLAWRFSRRLRRRTAPSLMET